MLLIWTPAPGAAAAAAGLSARRAALALHLIGKQRDRPEGERERTFEALNIKYKIPILPKPWIL